MNIGRVGKKNRFPANVCLKILERKTPKHTNIGYTL